MNELELREIMATLGLAPRTVYIYVRRLQQADDWLRRRGSCLDTATAVILSTYSGDLAPSRSTRVQVRAALRHYYEAVGRTPSPYRAIHVPRKERMVCKALPEDASRKLFAAARTWDSGPEGLAVMLGMLMALRRFEIAKLAWRDFGGGMLKVMGKGSVQASVPVHPLVEERVAWWQQQRYDDPHSVQPGRHYLFEGRRHGRHDHVNPNTVWDWVDRVSQSAGLGHITTHVLRHTALATANDVTGDLRAVQELARHRDPGVTEGYTRVKRERMMAAMLAITYD